MVSKFVSSAYERDEYGDDAECDRADVWGCDRTLIAELFLHLILTTLP
ncbi:MAG: hypothetical protein AB1589_32120 [Cyanobacteriota bacterium]